ncbi:alpha/beta hydrolase fold protein [Roseibium sp. TrichSKD4]|nr:alpha/beta hydrolase fold protein [Roseibium sp. TrichSKD4]
MVPSLEECYFWHAWAPSLGHLRRNPRMMHGHHSAVFSLLDRKICSIKLAQAWVDVL